MRGVRRPRHLLGIAAVAALSAVVLTGCAEDPLAAQYRSGNNERYIAGDGGDAEEVARTADAPHHTAPWSTARSDRPAAASM
jgi:hypothetical protein